MKPVWSAVLLVGMMLAGCAASEDVQHFDAVEAPQRVAGAAYAYQMEGEFSVVGDVKLNGAVQDSISESERIERMPLTTVRILNTSFGPDGAYYLAAQQLAGAPDGLMVDGLGSPVLGKFPIAIRKSDLAEFPITVTQASRCDPGCRLTTTSMEMHNETFMDPYLAFPLAPGASWRSVAPLDADEGHVSLLVFESRALRMETVAGPHGDVGAVRVETTVTGPDVDALEEAVRQELEDEGAQDVTIAFNVDGTIVTWYAPSLGAVVQDDALLGLEARVGLTIDGQRIDSHMRSRVSVQTYLSGASLDARDEMDLPGVHGFLDDGQPLTAPGSNATAAGAYTLRTTADSVDINIAEDDGVAFTVDVEPELPPGHTVTYRVSDAMGDELASGAGTAFETALPAAGPYIVHVQALSEDGLVQAADSMRVTADHIGTSTVDCGQAVVQAAGVGGCPDVAVPIRTFTDLRGLEVSVTPTDALDQGGELRVTDAAGNAVSVDGTGTLRIGIEELSGLEADGKDWTASWHPVLAVQETADVTVHIDHGITQDGSAAGADGAAFWSLRGQWQDMQRRIPALGGL